MAENATRLRRLIAADVGECRDGDVDERLAALRGLLGEVPAGREDDLAALRTLGDDTRYRLVRLLVAAEDELCVCEITPLFEVSESAVSHALSDLTDAGLVSRRKEGTWRYYEATDRAAALIAALDDTRGGNG